LPPGFRAVWRVEHAKNAHLSQPHPVVAGGIGLVSRQADPHRPRLQAGRQSCGKHPAGTGVGKADCEDHLVIHVEQLQRQPSHLGIGRSGAVDNFNAG